MDWGYNMRIKHHYYGEEKDSVIDFLDKNEITYKIYMLPESRKKMCTFDLYEDQHSYELLKHRFLLLSGYESIKSIEYSKKEIEDAEWLTLRSMNTKVSWEYEDKTFRKTCSYKRLFMKNLYYRHSVQVDILSASKAIKWGVKQYFSGPNAADDFLFCSEKAKELLNDTWEGLEFWPVRKYNSTKYIPDLYQLIFKDVLPIEAIAGGKTIQCEGCGKKLMRFAGGIHKLELKKEYLNDPRKVYRTDDVLTDQLKGSTSFSLNIVSREFYQYCEANQMNRGMIYEPIKVV